MKLWLLAYMLLISHARRVQEQAEDLPKMESVGHVFEALSEEADALNQLLFAFAAAAPTRNPFWSSRTRDAIMQARGDLPREPYQYGDLQQTPSHWSDRSGRRNQHFETINRRLGDDLGFNMNSLGDHARRSHRGQLRSSTGDEAYNEARTGGYSSRQRGVVVPAPQPKKARQQQMQYEPYDYAEQSNLGEHWSDPSNTRQQHYTRLNRYKADVGFKMDSLRDGTRRSTRGQLRATGGYEQP